MGFERARRSVGRGCLLEGLVFVRVGFVRAEVLVVVVDIVIIIKVVAVVDIVLVRHLNLICLHRADGAICAAQILVRRRALVVQVRVPIVVDQRLARIALRRRVFHVVWRSFGGRVRGGGASEFSPRGLLIDLAG